MQMELSSIGLDQLSECGLVACSGSAYVTRAHARIIDQRLRTNSHHSN